MRGHWSHFRFKKKSVFAKNEPPVAGLQLDFPRPAPCPILSSPQTGQFTGGRRGIHCDRLRASGAAWASRGPKDLASYPAGSWGPPEADELTWGCEGGWRRP